MINTIGYMNHAIAKLRSATGNQSNERAEILAPSQHMAHRAQIWPNALMTYRCLASS